jgi:DAK2 domain fusion protein YloV
MLVLDVLAELRSFAANVTFPAQFRLVLLLSCRAGRAWPDSSISQGRGWLTTTKGNTRGHELPSGAAQQLLAMTRQAERRLAGEVALLNALNVFPVPDGDTGSNMLATIREALRGAEAGSGSDALEQLASGALLGARGNSGVILSQLFRAQHEVLAGLGDLTSDDLAAIMARAAGLAQAIISNPVEGTMLSVLQALSLVQPERTTEQMLRSLLRAAETAVARTPEQLPILQAAQVVDSGGYGLLLVLQGWYQAWTGEPAPAPAQDFLGVVRAREQVAAGAAHPAELVSAPAGGYGYCITLLAAAPAADEAVIRQRLAEFGDSVLVAVAGGAVKLHVHSPDPDAVHAYARELGPIISADISNIDQQTAAVPPIPVIAVAPGEGLARVFRSFGAVVVGGGAGHNPSTADLLRARRARPGPALLLPNDGNIVNTARQAAAMDRELAVVPAKTIPQGVAATLAYDASASLEENVSRMTAAAGGVRSAELARAARDARIGATEVRSGQLMVMFEGELLGAGDPGLQALTSHAAAAKPELATIYCGISASDQQAAEVATRLRSAMPELQIEVVRGDQPQPEFILGFE